VTISRLSVKGDRKTSVLRSYLCKNLLLLGFYALQLDRSISNALTDEKFGGSPRLQICVDSFWSVFHHFISRASLLLQVEDEPQNHGISGLFPNSRNFSGECPQQRPKLTVPNRKRPLQASPSNEQAPLHFQLPNAGPGFRSRSQALSS
jgi:hypothetical protein